MTIVDYVFSLFGIAFSAVFDWFFQLLIGAQALGLYISVFCIYCVVRFLIKPLIGEAIAEKRADEAYAKNQERRKKYKSNSQSKSPGDN